MTAGPLYSQLELEQVIEHINSRNAASKRAQIQCTALFAGLYFKNFPQQVDGLVFSVRQNGMLVFVPALGIKAPVFLNDDQALDEVKRFDPDKKLLVLGSSRDPLASPREFSVFSKVRVELYGRSASLYAQPQVAARLVDLIATETTNDKTSLPRAPVAQSTNPHDMAQAVKHKEQLHKNTQPAGRALIDSRIWSEFSQSSSSLYKTCHAHQRIAFDASCRGMTTEHELTAEMQSLGL
eukprot:TRINITY_DN3031_c0_g3_i3.p1 TRINITY_DN3031_c0_g3~~TRINITY_DN3031_c0_g3_i3.p1  ORF type:complete len:238 (+),score=45.11 TRINITY_DN3031_c0_g3_i3:246-959(+)